MILDDVGSFWYVLVWCGFRPTSFYTMLVLADVFRCDGYFSSGFGVIRSSCDEFLNCVFCCGVF